MVRIILKVRLNSVMCVRWNNVICLIYEKKNWVACKTDIAPVACEINLGIGTLDEGPLKHQNTQ